nr:MAG TPA: hypothetical protein [Bacteriophage sp.]
MDLISSTIALFYLLNFTDTLNNPRKLSITFWKIFDNFSKIGLRACKTPLIAANPRAVEAKPLIYLNALL